MAEKRNISEETKAVILKMQINETTEAVVYKRLAKYIKDDHNRDIVLQIADEEKRHAKIWQRYTGIEAKPKRFKVFWYLLLARVLGFTFALKLMEKGESVASSTYASIEHEVPEAQRIAFEEDVHEEKLIAMLDEERLQYVGSMVLGVSDALVELSGTLAGLSFALQNNKIIALSGLITGISAALSMGSSEYLSNRSDGEKNALKSGLYTGVVYLITVIFLVLPYLLFPPKQFLFALVVMLGTVVIIIFLFTYYISVAKDMPFLHRFVEMTAISLGVAALSFVIGIIVKRTLGIEL